MVFSSITFLFYFLPIFLAAYFLTPTIQAKNIVTLLFSLVFYAWGEPRFVIVLMLSIVFNFCAAPPDRRARGIVPPVCTWGRGRGKPAAARNLQIRQFHHR